MASIEIRFYSQKPHTDKTETVKGVKGDNISFRVQKNNPITAAREFKNTLAANKETIDADKRWRVDSTHRASDYKKDTLITTKAGSTVAVTRKGDIISVSRNPNDTARGADLLKIAVKNGGKKLDSFDGNHDFYAKNGFEAVSRTRFDEQYAPDGWVKGKHRKEDVVFYKYVGVGNVKNKTMSDVEKNIPYSADYDTAQAIRDNDLKKKRKK